MRCALASLCGPARLSPEPAPAPAAVAIAIAVAGEETQPEPESALPVHKGLLESDLAGVVEAQVCGV